MNGYTVEMTTMPSHKQKRGRPKKQPLYGADRFRLGDKLTHRYEYGMDAHYEMVLTVMRWFWYEEKRSIVLSNVRDALDVRKLMESIYRKDCEGTVSDGQWPNVLELIYKPKIERFFAKHGARLSELNLIS